MKCEWVKDNLVFYVYDELADDARYEFEQHVGRCPECAQELEQVREFRVAASASAVAVTEPSASLLAAARMRLNEALETAEQGGLLQRWTFDLTRWMHAMKLQPAAVAAVFLFGFALGGGAVYQVARGGVPVAGSGKTEAPVSTSSASLAGIRSVVPDLGSNRVTIQYDTVRTEEAQGSMNDPRIQQLLVAAAHNTYNPGLRQDSVGLLALQSYDQTVRQSLMYSLRNDVNPGVRLTALDGLGPFVKEDQRVRDEVLQALLNDSNAGVRFKAIQLLQPVRADSTVRVAMEHLAIKDKNESIRAQAQAVMAQTPEFD